MKIKVNYLNDTSNANKNDKPNWASEARRHNLTDDSEPAVKPKQTDSPLKEEMKFASLLTSAAKTQKNSSRDDDSNQDQRDDEKKERLRDKEASESAGDRKNEKYDSSGGGQFGGQGGFGERGNIGSLNLNEAFAARSILHIADLERLISTIRAQSQLGGKREIILQMRRSVLEGLQVKITTDPGAKVQIEFLVANDKVRSEVEKHSSELAEILRGRGVNLETLKTTVRSDSSGGNSSFANDSAPVSEVGSDSAAQNDELSIDNTFDDLPENKGANYQA
jgi:hypothetical protein